MSRLSCKHFSSRHLNLSQSVTLRLNTLLLEKGVSGLEVWFKLPVTCVVTGRARLSQKKHKLTLFLISTDARVHQSCDG